MFSQLNTSRVCGSMVSRSHSDGVLTEPCTVMRVRFGTAWVWWILPVALFGVRERTIGFKEMGVTIDNKDRMVKMSGKVRQLLDERRIAIEPVAADSRGIPHICLQTDEARLWRRPPPPARTRGRANGCPRWWRSR